MIEPQFEPRLREDGTLDPEPLARMGLEWLTGWMRDRLGGRDPWFPIDRRSDEDPEVLLVGLVRTLGSGHPLSVLLGQAARKLLEEAGPESPFLRSLLRLCQQAPLPETEPWFTARLKTLADHPEEFHSLWPEGALVQEILFAALRQSPGRPGNPARPEWEKLLTRPETATHAFTALGSSLEQQASHLVDWWQACPPEDRGLELSQILFEGLAEGEDKLQDAFGRIPSLPAELREAINRELRDQGARSLPASDPPTRRQRDPLKNAGYQREFLLNPQKKAA
jgi:hypothetical protein